jgi:GH35 family endo-1,4-beta-xylanase
LNLKLDLVRLSCFWPEIEKTKDYFDFSQIENILEMAQKKEQKIILTIGMKAIRWPEFYVPGWTNYEQVVENPERLLLFVKKTIETVSKYTCVQYLQVENEPLDKSGPQKLTVPSELLEQEITLARQLSGLPIVLTAWGNKSLRDNRISKLAKLADIIGLDFYCQIPDGKGGYWGPDDPVEEIIKTTLPLNKPIWVTELQTNPWKNSPGLSPERIMAVNLEFAKKLPVEAILFWGYEYRNSQNLLKPQLLFDYQPDFS